MIKATSALGSAALGIARGVLLLAGSVVCIAESPPASEPAPQPTGLQERLQVRLVQLPILAMDRHGEPIGDLRVEEITVKDRRQDLRVAYLNPLRPPALESAPVADVRLRLDAPGGGDTGGAALRVRPHYVVFFVDVENDDPLLREESRALMVEFARSDFVASATTAVLAYDGTLHVELPFTPDVDAVAAALQRAWSRHGRHAVDTRARIRRLMTTLEDCTARATEFSRTADERCVRDATRIYTEQMRPRAESFLTALRQAIEFSAGLGERTTLIGTSHGATVDTTPELLEAIQALFGIGDHLASAQLDLGFGNRQRLELDRILELAIAQRVALNFVDRMRPPTGDSSAAVAHAFEAGARPLAVAHSAPQETLREIATATGGLLVTSQNLGSGLDQIARAQNGAYELGYYTEEFLTEKRLARVKIDCRRRGVRLSHRRGSYAPPRARLGAAPGYIVMGAPSAQAGVDTERSLVTCKLVIDPQSLGYQTAGDESVVNFTLHFRVEDASGRRLAESFHFINHAYPLQIWESNQLQPPSFDGWVSAPFGAYALTASLRNITTGWEGQISSAVELTPPRADPADRDSGDSPQPQR